MEESLKQSIISQIEELSLATYLASKKDEINILEHLPNIDYQDTFGISALIWACGNGYVDIVKSLINFDINLDLQSKDGSTALINAVRLGNLDIVKLLLEAKANV